MLRGVIGRQRQLRPTLLCRCLLLIAAELVINGVLWMVAAIVFRGTSRFLSLCLLAWTLGLRHGLDADHISVIDNATRRIVSCPRVAQHTEDGKQSIASRGHRRPVTCGLFFSLGHSTIVVGVICAIAISLGVVNRLGGVSSVGGIIGASVSGATLFLFAIINSILLFQSVRSSRAQKVEQPVAEEESVKTQKDPRFRGVFTRMAYPLFKLVDSPWKMYPIGVLFGLGFDTASSIALLGIAGATNTQVQSDRDLGSSEDGSLLPGDTQGNRSDASIIVLALLFTAGMTLVDSLDSILMINAYAPGELLQPKSDATQGKSWFARAKFFTRQDQTEATIAAQDTDDAIKADPEEEKDTGVEEVSRVPTGGGACTNLSQVLTLLSILLAFAISIITIMGLIGENCSRCARAASKQDETSDGGLEGRWWLFWQQANDASGIIGACIVAVFAVILAAYHATRLAIRLYRRRTNKQ